MNEKLSLPNITLVAMTSVLIDDTIKALMYSSKDIDFAEIKLITDKKPNYLPDKIKFEFTEPITNINEWNHRVVFNLNDYIETDYVLLIHDDGFVVNANSWRKEFLNYDYVGAPWSHKHLLDRNGEIISVGNSVSLRSKKLLGIPKRFNMPWVPHDGNFNEDTQICVWNRNLFLDNGCMFADYETAKYFSHEEIMSDYDGINPFCFHNFGGGNSKYKTLIDNFKF